MQDFVFRTLRQQSKKAAGKPQIALSDFIAPADSGKQDYIGAFCVSTGFGVPERAAQFEKDHDDYNSIMLKALADRLAEALAEYLHLRIRKEFWGYASDEQLENNDLIREELQRNTTSARLSSLSRSSRERNYLGTASSRRKDRSDAYGKSCHVASSKCFWILHCASRIPLFWTG